MIKNSKAQGMSTSTIVLLILGLIILVVLVLGFTLGWNKILPFVKSNNIDTVVNGCELACTTANTYDFCSYPRPVNDGVNKKFEATCHDLATNPTFTGRNYGVADCPNLCPSS